MATRYILVIMFVTILANATTNNNCMDSSRNLNLRNSNLTKISAKLFTNISYIDELDISGNNLKIIKHGVFDYLTSLKHLILNNCKLTYISRKAFKNLGNLTVLKLAGNNFKSKINWRVILSNLERLKHLDLRYSNVSNLPNNMFSKNIWLRRLILGRNNLSDINVNSTLFKNLVHLDFLDISYCNITHLSSDVFTNNKYLRTLLLSGNHLMTILDFSFLSKLKKLSLKSCNLTGFPNSTFNNLSSLQELDISRNSLTNFPTEYLSSLKSLVYLNLGYNNLQRISNITFLNMSALKKLILSGNKFIPEKGLFRKLTELKTLELNDCGLNHWYFQNYYTHQHLEELKLSKNPLEYFDEWQVPSDKLSNLKKLDIRKCNLRYLPENVFEMTPKIKRLLLADNKLISDNNSSMKFIELLTDLQQLDLSFNKISSINPDNFRYNHQLQSLKLVGNPWICGCYVSDILQWAVSETKKILLIGSSKSITSHIDNTKPNSLFCVFDPETSPIKMENPENRNSTITMNLHITWAHYVHKANCLHRILAKPK